MHPLNAATRLNPTAPRDCILTTQRRSPRACWPLMAAPLLLLFGCASAVPNVPAGAPSAISFGAPSEASEAVQVVREGHEEQRCELPCTMQVPSGSAMVVWSRNPKRFLPTVIPTEPSLAQPKYSRSGQRLVGGIFTIVGLLGAGVALGVTGPSESADTQFTGGVAALALSGVGLVGLIVMLTSGKDEVLFTPANTASR